MKKGFTLIELLAVIAILAILTIIAVPRILKLYEEGKRNTFVTQAQNLYKAAEQNYLANVLKGKTISRYYYADEEDYEYKLEIRGSRKYLMI